jgi:predicted nucleic acid-binding protein
VTPDPGAVPLLLIDTSALGRAPKPLVGEALNKLRGRPATCTPRALEVLYSARNQADFDRLTSILSRFEQLEMTREVMELARDLQALTMATGNHRCAGPLDMMTAAAAITHGASVVHYDQDFEQLAALHPGLRGEWIVPRGSVD